MPRFSVTASMRSLSDLPWEGGKRGMCTPYRLSQYQAFGFHRQGIRLCLGSCCPDDPSSLTGIISLFFPLSVFCSLFSLFFFFSPLYRFLAFLLRFSVLVCPILLLSTSLISRYCDE
ncbi:hypothetical protein GGR56DRAFT_639009 [Xylariaceae sp. FL0804]|nr:hypothetical protein GGR56DRAFT_639009 [Xylariaceae sp. FL0804]